MSNDPVSQSAVQERVAYSRPERPAVIGFAVIATFVAALALWSALAPVAGAAIAQGGLQVQGKRQAVQHPDGGVVKDLLVKEGDRVTRGQVLLTLSDSEPRSRQDVLRAERDALLAQQARLVAERDGLDAPDFGADLNGRGADPGLRQSMANERAVMTARLRQYETQIGVLRQKVVQLREQETGLRAQLAGVERQQVLLEEEARGARQLLASGYTPKTRVLALERDLAKLESDRGARLSDIARAEQAAGETELEITKLERTRIADIVDELRTTQSRLAEQAPKLDAAKDVLERTQVLAPATGSVVGMEIFTEGGVIQAGARLLEIVPDASPLIAEARLHLSDVSEVRPGSKADVRLISVNRSERPNLRGEIITVSADRLTDERSGEGYYSVQVRLDPEDVRSSNVDLQPGMPVEVIVANRPRTLVQYLVSPLTDEITGAFRER